MEQQLERIINTENVLVVADDLVYVPYLVELEKRGMTVTVAQLKGDFGSRMYHSFRYLDIMYPIGLCIGLQEDEVDIARHICLNSTLLAVVQVNFH